MAEPVVAMQMFTLRDLTKEDYAGTVKKVAEMGYPAIQVSGFGNSTPEDIRKMLDDLELGSAGTHLGYAMFRDEFEKVVEITKTLRAGFAVVPSLPKEVRETPDQWKQLAEQFAEWAEKLKAEDLGFAYHNHSFEFETKVDGAFAYDLLYTGGSEAVEAEIDTYWVQYGGADPVAYLEKYAGRITIVHFKDMGEGEEKPMVPVGEGILDWPKIIAACKAGGTEFMAIEQDRTAPLGPLEAAKVSLENCRTWGLV